MNKREYAELDAVGLAAVIKKGEVTVQEVTNIAIEAIESMESMEFMNTKLNAVVIKNYDNAKNVANQPLPDTPIAGAPFLL